MASGLPGIGRAADWTITRGRPRADQTSPWAGYLAAPLVAGTLIAVWLISGVPIGDISKFIGFEALYVVLPGCLFYLLLSPDWSIPGGRIRVLAIGWPLGYAIEIAVFALTAALHARGAFTFLPLVVLITVAPVVFHRRRRTRSVLPAADGVARAVGWGRHDWGVESLVAAIAIITALVLLGVRTFAVYPLPDHASSAFYFVDNVWDIAMSAEALHHWPIVQPYIAGQPIRYYIGVFFHIAALKQVTGVPVATTILR